MGVFSSGPTYRGQGESEVGHETHLGSTHRPALSHSLCDPIGLSSPEYGRRITAPASEGGCEGWVSKAPGTGWGLARTGHKGRLLLALLLGPFDTLPRLHPPQATSFLLLQALLSTEIPKRHPQAWSGAGMAALTAKQMRSLRIRNEKKAQAQAQGAHSSEGKTQSDGMENTGAMAQRAECPRIRLPGQESSEEGVLAWRASRRRGG